MAQQQDAATQSQRLVSKARTSNYIPVLNHVDWPHKTRVMIKNKRNVFCLNNVFTAGRAIYTLSEYIHGGHYMQ